MRAILYRRYGPPGVLELADLPRPVPGAGEVLIRVAAVAVGPGDCKTRAGLLHGFHPVTFPKIPGRSGTGHVAALGPGVAGLTPGDAVYFSTGHTEPGCCADYILRPAADLLRLAPGSDLRGIAAAMHPAICAWLALTREAGLKRGERLLIVGGSGTIGDLAIRLGRHLGAHVSAIGSARHLDRMRAAGAREVHPPGHLPEGRFDVVFDLIGGAAQTAAAGCLRPGGRLCHLQAEPVTAPPRPDVQTRRVMVDYGPDIAREVVTLLGSVLAPCPGPVLPPEACAEAHRLVEAGGLGAARVVLDFG